MKLDSATRTDLIKRLARKRLAQQGAPDVVFDDFLASTEAVMMGTPEGMIVGCAESFVALTAQGLTEQDAFQRIEQDRVQFAVGGTLPRPLTLATYLRYRLNLEPHVGLPISGAYLDEAAGEALRTVRAAFGLQSAPDEPHEAGGRTRRPLTSRSTTHMTRHDLGRSLAALAALGFLATAGLHSTGYDAVTRLAADVPSDLGPVMPALWLMFSIDLVIIGLIVAIVAYRPAPAARIMLVVAALSPLAAAGLQLRFIGFVPPTAILLAVGAVTLGAAAVLPQESREPAT